MSARLPLALAALALAASPAGAKTRTIAEGTTPGYRALAELPVMQNGRIKPLDTLARIEVKLIYGRETISLTDADGNTHRWEPLAAFLGWWSRSGDWDAREILLIDAFEYRPFKRFLLSRTIKAQLAAIAAKPSTSEADRSALRAVADAAGEIDEPDLSGLLARTKLPEADRKALAAWDAKFGEGRKWVSPEDLDGAVVTVDGRSLRFHDWFGELMAKQGDEEATGPKPPLSPLETKALEIGQRLMRFEKIRDHTRTDILVAPRPTSAAYLKFTAAAVKKIRSGGGPGSLTALEEDALGALSRYYSDLRGSERKTPGEDAEFDRAYAKWLRESGGWVSLGAVSEAEPKELAQAGFPESQVAAFRAAFAAVEKAEKASPGRLEAAPALALVAASRDLAVATIGSEALAVSAPAVPSRGEVFAVLYDGVPAIATLILLAVLFLRGSSVGQGRQTQFALGMVILVAELAWVAFRFWTVFLPSGAAHLYPEASAMAREVTYNRFAPFYRAPMAYGLGLVSLLICLGITAPSTSTLGRLRRGLYGVGLLAFAAGIALEVCGFYYRVRISGWAPVTNMYETVIWVALVSSVLGLILELVYRRVFAATAASGVALLATLLAANVSLLDPNIGRLEPVLRSNYWLTIHVLTIVSSYAAFSLAMGLGVLGVLYYLSATYRRSVGFGELLARPTLLGLPLLAVGTLGLVGWRLDWMGGALDNRLVIVPVFLILMAGIMAVEAGVFGALGELANRVPAAVGLPGVAVLLPALVGVAAWWADVQPVGWPESIHFGWTVWVSAVLGLILTLLGLFGHQSRSAYLVAQSEAASLADEELAGSERAASATRARAAAGGGVATLERPTVAAIRAQSAGAKPPLDPRGAAMQAIAGVVKPLANLAYRAMQVGVLLVAAGTFLGGWWADKSWGRFWGWDAKEVWALATLVFYLIPLHCRFAGLIGTFGLTFWSVACWMSVLMAWYGVNFVLGVGLHTYGFGAGGGQALVFGTAFAVIGFAAASWWRRSLAYQSA